VGVGHPSLASEFPNDNTEISGGAVWICPELTGPATALLAPAPSFQAVEPAPFVLLQDEEPLESELLFEVEPAPFVLLQDEEEPLEIELPLQVELPRGSGVATEEPEPFRAFQAALVAALLAEGATRSAALVPQLLRLEPLPPDGLTKEALVALKSRGYLEDSGRYSQSFRDVCGAWCGVLRGASHDMSGCGTVTLDRFGAELLAALLGAPTSRAEALRRDLRKAGVAAFGVLQAA
jgi:hypothetical protein